MTFDPNRSPVYVVLFAVAVSGAFTAAIMALHVATRPIVERNEELLEQRALVELFALGDVDTMTDARIAETYRRRIRRATINEDKPERMELLIAYDSDRPLDEEADPTDKRGVKGYGFPIGGVGFWARIEGYLAVTPDFRRTLGVTFMRHQETPGLGGRITEPEFKRWFRPGGPHPDGLDVTPPPPGEPYVRVSATSPDRSDPSYDRHVDSITGATGTSTAVGEFINADIRRARAAAVEAGIIEGEQDSPPGEPSPGGGQ